MFQYETQSDTGRRRHCVLLHCAMRKCVSVLSLRTRNICVNFLNSCSTLMLSRNNGILSLVFIPSFLLSVDMATASKASCVDPFWIVYMSGCVTDPVTITCGHNFCKNCITQHWDINTQEPVSQVFCRKTRAARQHFRHWDGGSAQKKKATLRKIEAKIQQMIQERQLKIPELKHSLQVSNDDGDRLMRVQQYANST